MSKLYLMCAAWVLILVFSLGVAGPAMVSAKNSLAVVAGVGLVGAAVWGLIAIGKLIYVEVNREKNT